MNPAVLPEKEVQDVWGHEVSGRRGGQFLSHDSSVTNSKTRRVCSHHETDSCSVTCSLSYSYFATSAFIEISSNMICTELLEGAPLAARTRTAVWCMRDDAVLCEMFSGTRIMTDG